MTRLCWIGCVAVLLLAGPSPAQAQSTADAYFHEAARQYVADNVQAARRAVERGLELAPSDPRLLALQKKLQQGKRPDGRRDNSSDGSQSGSQQNENSSSPQSSKGGQEPSSEQSGAARTGEQDADPSRSGGDRSRAPDARRDDPPETNAQSSSGGRPANQSGRADTIRRGQNGQGAAPLSRAQAERLLRALEGQERQLLRQLRPRSSREPVEKDW